MSRSCFQHGEDLSDPFVERPVYGVEDEVLQRLYRNRLSATLAYDLAIAVKDCLHERGNQSIHAGVMVLQRGEGNTGKVACDM